VARIKQGSTVLIHDAIRLNDGSLVDSSSRDAPLTIKLGEGKLFPSVERALAGSNAGESATIRVSATEAFGPYDPELVMVLARAQLPTDVEPHVGAQLGTRAPDRSVTRLLVTKVDGSSITLDGNHPLAGKPLTVEVKVLSVM
jgi:FKBP-type peptidyl-prolyl cis-trans isomerase 2